MNVVTDMGHGLGYARRDGVEALPPFPLAGFPTAASLPAVVDNRHLFLPAFDQGPYGTCTCNSFASLVEHQLLAQHITVPYHRSRLFPYYYSGVIEGNTGDVGRDPRDVLAALQEHGTPPEQDWPYDPAHLLSVAPSVDAQKAAVRRHILSATQLPISLAAVQTALAHGYGVAIAIPVFASFESADVANTGIVPIPTAGEQLLGFHQITLVGYTNVALPDVPANHLIVLNSWGAGWGKNGYCFLPYEWIGSTANSQPLTEELIAVELIS